MPEMIGKKNNIIIWLQLTEECKYPHTLQEAHKNFPDSNVEKEAARIHIITEFLFSIRDIIFPNPLSLLVKVTCNKVD